MTNLTRTQRTIRKNIQHIILDMINDCGEYESCFMVKYGINYMDDDETKIDKVLNYYWKESK